MADPADLAGYVGTFFWGGPVEMGGLRALLRSESAPSGAQTIIENVHVVSFDDAVAGLPAGLARLRFYIGYAGWAPGQLDDELARGSWDVQNANERIVFAEDPRSLWDALKPVREFRAGLDPSRLSRAGRNP